MKKCEIYYFRFPNCQNKQEKLSLVDNTRFKQLDFDRIFPDKNNVWINQTDNDFENLLPVCDKQVKLGKSENSIFKLFSNGVSTNRDEWVYDFSINNLEEKMKFFFEEYNNEVDRWGKWKIDNSYQDIRDESNPVLDKFLAERNLIKWSKMLKRDKLRKHKQGEFDKNDIKDCIFRPFIKNYLYYGYVTIDIRGEFDNLFTNDNKIISCRCVNAENIVVLSNNGVSDLNYLKMGNGGTFCLPLYIYDKDGNPHDNITDWALSQFQNYYQQSEFKPRFKLQQFDYQDSEFKPWFEIQKLDIFHYVYAVLHNPAYREKYEQNLKREFPRIPFYDDFAQWAEWGRALMELHINYETVEKYPLNRLNTPPITKPKAKLKADKINSVIQLDDNTSLSGIPLQAWDYKLGNRSALEWVLDQYKEKKPKDSTIAEKFNNYRFADYKEQVIELLMRVCTVSVETIKIVEAMKNSHGRANSQCNDYKTVRPELVEG